MLSLTLNSLVFDCPENPTHQAHPSVQQLPISQVAVVGFLLTQAVPYRQAVGLCLLSEALTEQLLLVP